MAKKPSKKTLNASLWRTASLLARERANHRCEKCGQPATQTHHVYTRDFHRIRYDRHNLVALCFSCHKGRNGAHDSPLDFMEWFKSYRPEDYAFIRDPANRKPINRSIGDRMDLRAELEAELRDLRDEMAA
jgi:hypothetical protein